MVELLYEGDKSLHNTKITKANTTNILVVQNMNKGIYILYSVLLQKHVLNWKNKS